MEFIVETITKLRCEHGETMQHTLLDEGLIICFPGDEHEIFEFNRDDTEFDSSKVLNLSSFLDRVESGEASMFQIMVKAR